MASMRLCINCLHDDDRQVAHCPSCGGTDFAKLSSKGCVTELPGESGMPCQGCLETGRELKLRYYRRVVAMVVVDRIYGTAGYFCSSCRRRQFGLHLGLTLLLGWWGLFALLFRNPYALLTNLWALAAPPLGAGRFGALDVNEIRANAREDERLADVYMSMPSWFEHVDEAEIDLILTERDYYATLGLRREASSREVKTAWREQVKLHHPDADGGLSHERIVEINAAYKVLGDGRLRHAYDHQDELVAFLERLRDGADEDESDMAGYNYGCALCRSAFRSFDDFADHVDADHPDVDYGAVLVELQDGVPVTDASDESVPVGWRCKTCQRIFEGYDDALSHADRAHPERVVIDARAAVERA